MGKWNYRRTWRPKNYYRDQRIPSPPTYYDTEFKLRESWKNVDLSWEERFCISVGIPWKKVVNAKKYMHCYDNVVKWNDSAGELAFSDAKQRFWEKINGIPADDPQPDLDMYNNEIDWNPAIDLELLKDLDRAYFNPDEPEKAEYVYAAKKDSNDLVPGCILGLDSKDVSNSGNPWACDKNANFNNQTGSWNCANNSMNKSISDPWERGITQDDRKTKDNAWGGGANDSWHQNQFSSQKVHDISKDNWGSVWRTDRFVKETGCGVTQPSRGPNRQRGGYMGTSFGRGLDGPRHNGSGGWGLTVGCRKREGSQHYTSTYKSQRVQSDDYREGNRYRR